VSRCGRDFCDSAASCQTLMFPLIGRYNHYQSPLKGHSGAELRTFLVRLDSIVNLFSFFCFITTTTSTIIFSSRCSVVKAINCDPGKIRVHFSLSPVRVTVGIHTSIRPKCFRTSDSHVPEKSFTLEVFMSEPSNVRSVKMCLCHCCCHYYCYYYAGSLSFYTATRYTRWICLSRFCLRFSPSVGL